MRRLFKVMILPVSVLMICSMFIIPGNAKSKNAAPLGNGDLKLHYAKKSLVLFGTEYGVFTGIVGKTGVWEDENKYQYTWDKGQAAFIKTGKMKKPQLVQIVLNGDFRTPRGIQKGSTLDELLKAYPGVSETTEAGNGLWYVYKWTAKSGPQMIKGRDFSLSFFIEDGQVKNVFLKLEGEETAEIPVG